ncbi:MAG TPA: membrane-associated protein [Candidatus Binatia bacterium]
MIPFSVKLFYTLFVGVLVPVYWRHYGLANFLWFSDLALLIGLAATWLESPLLASMQAVSVLLLELVWIIDFLARLVTGKPIIGIAEYMFKSDKPPFVRGLSLFHLLLPFFLAWLVYVLGYDSRAWILQTVLFWMVVLVCYYFTKPSDNINWVFGIGSQRRQKISPRLYLVLLLITIPVCIYLPTHFFLYAVVPRRMF